MVVVLFAAVVMVSKCGEKTGALYYAASALQTNHHTKRKKMSPTYRKPTPYEISEFTEIKKWRVRHPGTGENIVETCSFAEIERRWFEGFNLPFIADINESFESANDRMKRYYEIEFDSRKEMRSAV